MEEITWLIRGLNEGPPGTRLWHVEALGRTANPDAAPPLCALLRDEPMRDAALEALIQLGDAAVEPLCRELAYGRRDIHPHVIRVLGQIGDTRAVPLLCEALKEKDWRLRDAALEALEALDDPRALPQLVEVLTGGVWERAERAAAALGSIGDARAVPPLLAALHEGHIEAAVSLGKIALRDPVPELRAALPVMRSRLFTLALARAEESERALRTAMERIEAATVAMNLPLPSDAPLPSVETHPQPPQPPPHEAEALPLPAAAPPAGPGRSPKEPLAREVSASPKPRSWWHGLRHWLRGG
jgi:hypothetical protein